MNHAEAARYAVCRERGGVVDLSRRTQLLLTGADRVRYLNGQVTSDVRKLPPGHSQAACVTTAKGKLCAEVVITALPDALAVDAEPELREALLARLERYIVADDVVIEDATGSPLLHYISPATPLSSRFPLVPGSDGALPSVADAPPPSTFERVLAVRRFGREGWDIRLSPEALAVAQSEQFGESVVIDPVLAELLRIEAGLPRWGNELDENTLPPEAGLDRTHIDYHKGCYIGQEVISRLRSVGHVNRRLTGFISEDGMPLLAGTLLFPQGSGAPSVGLLTSTAFSFALEKPIALGYLKRGSPEGVLLARPAGGAGPEAAITVRELPFVP